MNILLIYPRYPDTYWSFRHALKFISKKAVNPPLGLMTVSSMLPKSWNKKLTDLNIESLKKQDILWADYVFISAMNVQQESAASVISLCKSLNKKLVAGGPLFTEHPEKFPDVDHLVLNEAEITLPVFLKDLAMGKAERIYHTDQFADMNISPVPDYSVVNKSKYNTFNIQFSRGCPFNCDFCDITALLGHRARTKSAAQVIEELEIMYQAGWRRSIFFVDDNFIGNKHVLKKELLPAIIQWMKSHKYPFGLFTEASINLSDDDELINLMVEANFEMVFIGIETTEESCLNECGKHQNVSRDLVKSVQKIQDKGLEVSGGFIVGFDNDTPAIFQKQINFIKESGIISAMVGLLNAPKRTRLYKRLFSEGRILEDFNGNNTDHQMNFIPKMDLKLLLEGYNKIIAGIYGGKNYYKRVLEFIKRFTPSSKGRQKITFGHIIALLRSFFRLGIIDRYRLHYWKLFLWTLINRPRSIPLAIGYSIYGFHFRKVFKNQLQVNR